MCETYCKVTMMHYVVVCPDKYCRGISILSKKVKTPSCRTCNKSYPWDKYKIPYKSEIHNDAIAARTQLLTKQSDSGPTFDEIREQGGLDEPERAYPDKNNNENEDNRSPKQIVLDSIKNHDTPTMDNIIQKSIEDGLDENKARKIAERILQKGYAIKKSNNNIELI